MACIDAVMLYQFVNRQPEFIEALISHLPNGGHRSGYRIGLGRANCFTSMGDDEPKGSQQQKRLSRKNNNLSLTVDRVLGFRWF